MRASSGVVAIIVGMLCVSLNSVSFVNAAMNFGAASMDPTILNDAVESDAPPPDEPGTSQWIIANANVQAHLFGGEQHLPTNFWLQSEPQAGLRSAGYSDAGDSFEFECLRTIFINDYLDRTEVPASDLAQLAAINANPVAAFGLMKNAGEQVLVLAVIPSFEANGQDVHPFIVSNIIPVVDHTAFVDAFHFLEAAQTVASASRPVHGPPVPECDNRACDDGMRQCKDNLDSANDACEALALAALASLALCAVGMTLALQACVMTGVGCGLFFWMGSMCAQLPAALAAIASCFALALAAYGVCTARVKQWSVCACILEW